MRVLTTGTTGQDILPAMFDHMPQEVVVLDSNAQIVLVNESFLRFGRENGMDEPEQVLGLNYLRVCLSAALDGDPLAGRISQALRELLTGQRATFATTYPCHSPMEERWFRMTATPWQQAGRFGLVLMHEDVTCDRLVEEAILHAREPPDAPEEGPRPFALQPYLDALGQQIEAVTGNTVFVEGSDARAVAPVRTWLQAMARVMLHAEPATGGPMLITAEPAGRHVVVGVSGLKSIPDAVRAFKRLPAHVVTGTAGRSAFFSVRLRAARKISASR